MAEVSRLIPKRTRPQWGPVFELTELAEVALVEVPLLGTVAAGMPLDLCERDERVAVPANMVRKDTYALRVRGHSMIDDQIQDGDIVVVQRRATAENGQSVVALINGERVTLKRFYVEPDGIRLQPANPSMPAILLRNEDVEILGIVTGVIRMS